MFISELNDRFQIAEYAPEKQGEAAVRLVDDALMMTIPYRLYTVTGLQTSALHVDAIATPEQLTQLKGLLQAILQATNAEIEAVQGWTRRIDE